jgi:hypothetical protein
VIDGIQIGSEKYRGIEGLAGQLALEKSEVFAQKTLKRRIGSRRLLSHDHWHASGSIHSVSSDA